MLQGGICPSYGKSMVVSLIGVSEENFSESESIIKRTLNLRKTYYGLGTMLSHLQNISH
jgi:hypothetical protein